MNPNEILRRYFGYETFRKGQETLIQALLHGRDAMGIMPTGGGKSLCYQIPALMLPGTALVISPLISLMKDQVAALKQAGIPAAYINSSLSLAQTQTAYQRCRQGAYKMIYVAPERLLTESFLSMAQTIRISMVAVDEAHCISQWGQDFRPSYLKITEFLHHLPDRPVVSAFTATATQQVQEDIDQALQLAHPVKVVTGFDRPNLRFEVLHPDHKRDTLLELVNERRQESGIIYCATRKDVEQVCALLEKENYSVTRYHAGLKETERQQNQDAFIWDQKKIMVATNAFGMGIDKSNVSFVIHYNMPKSLEAYYQEAGRAGRDGSPADCILLYSESDVTLARTLLRRSVSFGTWDGEERKGLANRDGQRLHTMVQYCRTTQCLRGYILNYFGQEHQEHCGNCSSCSTTFEEEDITTYAKMILSCIKRIRDALGYSLGPAIVVLVLKGSQEKRIQELRLDQLSTYGLMRDCTRGQIHEMLSVLEDQGFLYTEWEHGTVRLTRQAGEVLFHGQTVMACLRSKQKKLELERKGNRSKVGHSPMFEALRALRQRLAKEDNIPAYLVFSNATLMEMAEKKPKTPREFLAISGVGAYKANLYGQQFLQEIAKQTKAEEDESVGGWKVSRIVSNIES